jgi:cell division protein FtsI/penicillin-binding protein 2
VALLVAMVLAFGAIAVRLVYVQALGPDRYAALGASQRHRSVVLPSERGSIFDRNGHELALSIPQSTVWADPRLVTRPDRTARALAPVLGVDEATLAEKLRRKGAFVYLARKVDDKVAAQVRKLDLDGVALLDESKRFQPAGDLAASLLGTVGLDNDGLSGLELKYEDRLVGEPGELVFEQDPQGRQIPAAGRRLRPSTRGDDLVLTIDRSMQYETERALARQVTATHSRGGIAVVMDPRTGEILALASLRAGDEADPGPERPAERKTGPRPTANNAAVTDVFEPGSVNKVITVAAALEERRHRPTDVFTVPDNLKVSVKVFHDHDPHEPKRWSVTDIMVNSSNIGTIMIAQELGKERLDEYLRAFGFGRRTTLGLPGESAGIVPDPDEWTGPSIGAIPIGQAVAVTAVQMLGAYNTVANRGVYVEPKLVRAFVDAGGEEHPTGPSPSRRVVSTRTARQVSTMLTQVVEVGTGTRAAIEGYFVAGKTGTARKPSTSFRGYEEGVYVSSFAGFVPADDPRLSAIVILDDPTPIYGGLVAAPVFADLARYGLRLFRIPPPGTSEAGFAATRRAVGVPAAAAGDAARADGAAASRAAPVLPPSSSPATTAPPPLLRGG